MPILPDMYGSTPLDYALGKAKQRVADMLIFYSSEKNLDLVESTENVAMAEVIFSYLSEYGFMHSSSLVNEAIINAVEISLPSIGAYLDSRLIKVEHSFESKTQHAIKEESQRNVAALGDYGICEVDIWAPEGYI